MIDGADDLVRIELVAPAAYRVAAIKKDVEFANAWDDTLTRIVKAIEFKELTWKSSKEL